MDYQLVIVKGRSSNQAIRLPEGVVVLGRQPGCEVMLRSSQVSRKHCQLYEQNGLLMVKDLGSSNGTYVNGQKIEGEQTLALGDVLTVGPIRFRLETAGEENAAAAQKPGSTAIAEAVAAPVPLTEDDVFDLVVDEGSVDDAPTAAAVKAAPLASKPAPAAKTPPKPAPEAAPAAKAPPAPAPEKAAPPPPPEEEQIADDAVAEFLLNINLDDEKD